MRDRGREIASCAQHWTRRERRLHITHREAMASALAVRNVLPYIPPRAHLTIQSDATSTVIAWQKGSKVVRMNTHIVPMLATLHRQRTHVTSLHIPGKENTRADYLSRQPDAKDFRLRPDIFRLMCRRHNYRPTIDLFASRRNRQTRRFCSWRVDFRSEGNAFLRDWKPTANWLNPPWDLIPRCLDKLRREGATALCCLPMWRSTCWWHVIRKLAVTTPTIMQGVDLFDNPAGERMPAPHWPTLFCVLDGSRCPV